MTTLTNDSPERKPDLVGYTLKDSGEYYDLRCWTAVASKIAAEFPGVPVITISRAFLDDQERVVHCEGCGLPI